MKKLNPVEKIWDAGETPGTTNLKNGGQNPFLAIFQGNQKWPILDLWVWGCLERDQNFPKKTYVTLKYFPKIFLPNSKNSRRYLNS